MKKLIMVVMVVVMMVVAGCGSQQAQPVVSGYQVNVTVGGTKLSGMNVEKEIEVMKHDGFTILAVEGNVITATVTDAALNQYIGEGMWIKIDGVDIHLKRMID